MTCAVAGLALAVAALTACTGSDPAPTQTSAAVPSTTASTTTSTPPATSTTSTGPAFPAGLPDAAKTKDKAGAEAFSRYFVKQLNASWRKPDSSLLRPLCAPTSKSCTAHIGTAEKLRSTDQRYKSDAISIRVLQDLGNVDGKLRLLAEIQVLGAPIVKTTGEVVRTDKPSTVKNVFLLAWGGSGWRMADIRNI